MQEYYKFINEPLPYSYKAMEPFIDIQTMYLHHDKHLQTYVDNLNRALRDYPFLQTFTLEQLLCNLESMPMEIRTQIRNNAGESITIVFILTDYQKNMDKGHRES